MQQMPLMAQSSEKRGGRKLVVLRLGISETSTERRDEEHLTTS